MGYLNLLDNRLHFGELCPSLRRMPKTLIMEQRCSVEGWRVMVVKHRLCKNAVTYLLDFSGVQKLLTISLCLRELVPRGRWQNWELSLPWTLIPWGWHGTISRGQVGAKTKAPLIAPFLQMNLEPLTASSAWVLPYQLVKDKPWARLGFSMDFINIILLQIFFFQSNLN